MTARQIPGGAFVNGTSSRQIPGGRFVNEISSGGDVSLIPTTKQIVLTGYVPTIVVSAASGTITPNPVKNNNAFILGSLTALQVKVYDSTGALVVSKVITSDASGNIPFSDVLITPGATYYCLLIHPASGAVGSFKAVAT